MNGCFRKLALAQFCAAVVLASAGITAAAEPPDKAFIEKGRQVFLSAGGVGCAACHGTYAEGDVGIGPYNRGVNEAAVRAAIESVEEMQFLREELTDIQIGQIAAYYEWLGRLQLVKILVKRGRFIPDTVDIYPGTPIQLVLRNASLTPHTFAGEDMGFDPLQAPGREAVDVVWTAPEEEGPFTLRCTDCRLKNQKLTLRITRKAKPYAGASSPTRKLVFEVTK